MFVAFQFMGQRVECDVVTDCENFWLENVKIPDLCEMLRDAGGVECGQLLDQLEEAALEASKNDD